MSDTRTSIQPTHDHRETGDRYRVETRVNDRPLPDVPTSDPFVFHRVTVGWRDLLRAVLRRHLEVVVIVTGDQDIVEDVLELNADYLGLHDSTRHAEWDAQVEKALREAAR